MRMGGKTARHRRNPRMMEVIVVYKMLENRVFKRQAEFDFGDYFLTALLRHFEGPVSYKTIRSYCACRFCFTKEETKAALRTLSRRFPGVIKLGNRAVVFSTAVRCLHCTRVYPAAEHPLECDCGNTVFIKVGAA